MELAPGVGVDDEALATFCRANGVRRLGLFGSALRGQLRPDSDIDLLVEFEPGRAPGLLRLAAMELELANLVGRDVDLRTPADLSRYFRDEVSSSVLMTPPDDASGSHTCVRRPRRRWSSPKARHARAWRTKSSVWR